MVGSINPGVDVECVQDRYRRGLAVGDVLFVAVDKIDTRRAIWDALGQRVRFFADGRMSAEVIRVLAAADAQSRAGYPGTLFEAGEAFTGPCTARSTIFTANIAAGLMLSQFSRWLRGMPVEPDLTLNLLAGELSTGSGRGVELQEVNSIPEQYESR
jgi:sulfur carrier protein ThiS adenylyltransferase